MRDSTNGRARISGALPGTGGAPATAAPDPGRAQPTPAFAAIPAAGRVLVVDDNDGVRAVARRILVRAGYEVVEATNGIDALRKLDEKDKPVDVVLSDMVMPGMGGKDLAQEVQRRYPAAALVLMSGYAPAVLDGRDLFRDTVFLTKPFTPGNLLQGVAAALAARSP